MFLYGGIMTLIEFYDENAVFNVLASLVLRPERVIIVGENFDKINSFQKRMTEVMRSKKMTTQIICYENKSLTFPDLKKNISEIVEKYGDCVVDLTGGTEVTHAAVGAVSEKFPLSMHIVDLIGRKLVIFNDPNGVYKKFYKPTLSVEECITLYGGKTYCDYNKSFYEQEEVLTDIKNLWNICNKNCAEWNKTISNIGSAIKYYAKSEKENHYIANINEISEGFNKFNKRFFINEQVINKLKKYGYLSLEKDVDGKISFNFKNDFVFKILTISGKIFELYIFITLSVLKNGSQPLFDDGNTSVMIDWIPWENKCNIDYLDTDVKNEVDVMFVKGTRPIFISCKNGNIESDELYKLSVVADRFGGKTAEKILVNTYFEPDISLLRRARELNISVVSGVNKMSSREFCNRIIGILNK